MSSSCLDTIICSHFKPLILFCSGDFGRLGHGNSNSLFTPLTIQALHEIRTTQIACGDSHCLVVTMEEEVQSWGPNLNGQLGLGNTEDSLVPQKIQAFQGIRIKMVAAGAEHTAAVTEDGDLYGWGWGGYGNLGLGDRNDRLVPERVTAAGISGGWRHTMALTSDGKLYGWGWNKFGQLGVGDNLDHCSPVQVRLPDDQKVVQVSCGWRHTLAVTERNNVFAWGRGTNGQLGSGKSLDRSTSSIFVSAKMLS